MKIRAAVLETMGLPAPYAESRPLKIREVEIDPPGHGEVRVRVLAAGLCHSDLSVVNGDRPRPLPMVLGHESAGEVLECGPGVVDLVPGDRVVMVFMPSCGGCLPCQEGRPALCEPGAASNGAGTLLGGARRLRLDGQLVNHHVGVSCFAEQAVVSRRSCVKVDPDLTPAEAALFGCAVLTGVGAVINTARVQAGSSVAVLGLGGVGFSALLAAVASGARQVVALDLNEDKLALARRLGATDTVNAGRPRSGRRGARADQGRGRLRVRDGGRDSGDGSCVAHHPPRRQHGDGRASASGQAVRAAARADGGGGAHAARQLHRLGGAGPRHPALHRDVPAGQASGRPADGRAPDARHINRGLDRLATGVAMRDVVLF